MEKNMEFVEFSKIVKLHYGYKLTSSTLNYETKTIECVLYDSFYIELSIGDRYGIFGGAIAIGMEMFSLPLVMEHNITLNSNQKSIIANLNIIDEYCRLRLPDKFLEKFDQLSNR